MSRLVKIVKAGLSAGFSVGAGKVATLTVRADATKFIAGVSA